MMGRSLPSCFNNLLLHLLFTISAGWCLRLDRVSVPQYKVRGEMAILECAYQLEGDSLYSVKWYKENEEFYRFVPKSNPPQQSYKVEGIRVDHQMSDSKQVTLRSVTLKSSGVYRCEVSAEGPSFASAQAEAHMQVIFIPISGPQISGEQKEYQVGDFINLNCTSGKSFPESKLHWFINDRQVRDPRQLREYEGQVHVHGLVSSTLGLRVRASPHHFVNGVLKLRCTASISPVLWQGDRESVVERVMPLLDNREAMLLVKGDSVRFTGNACSLLVTLLLLVIT